MNKDIDIFIKNSYDIYNKAAPELNANIVSYNEYKDLIFSAGSALSNITHEQSPYVILRIGNIFMKAKKINDNLEISYIDKEMFDIITKGGSYFTQSDTQNKNQ